MKVLQVIDQAFRTTVEEQDDTILWLSQSMVGAGANLNVLLSGHGVQYAVLTRPQPTLSIGSWKQSEPACITQDMDRLVASGTPVYAVEEDLQERGLGSLPLRDGVRTVKRAGLVDLYEQVDQVWHW